MYSVRSSPGPFKFADLGAQGQREGRTFDCFVSQRFSPKRPRLSCHFCLPLRLNSDSIGRVRSLGSVDCSTSRKIFLGGCFLRRHHSYFASRDAKWYFLILCEHTLFLSLFLIHTCVFLCSFPFMLFVDQFQGVSY